MAETPVPIKKKSPFNWLLWWRIDSDELNKQVNEYETLSFYQSARGISFLALIFSAAVTVLVVQFFGGDHSSFIDAGLMLLVGGFISLGHKWAMIAGMLLWTFEKGFAILAPLQLGSTSVGGTFVMQIVWWAIYMHLFYLAFVVERKKSVVPIGSAN